jgi:hypothetical protein
MLKNESDPSIKLELTQDILLQVGDSLDPELYKSVEDWLKKK